MSSTRQMQVVCTLVIALAAGTSSGTALGADTDYLGLELRAEVEQLKQAVVRTPTNADNASERALVLYDWINAFALTGGYIPVDATANVSRVTAYGLPIYDEIDALVMEMALHDEDPEAIGGFAIEDSGPFQVRSYARIRQSYKVGNEPIEPGGGFLVANHFQANYGRFQADDPEGDNYISIESNNPDARFTTDSFDVSGMHGGFRAPQPQLVFRLEGATLSKGDTVTITYGDRSGGGRGLLMPDFSSDRMPFPVYLDLDGSNLWLSLPIQPVRVVGGPVKGVHGFAPSIVGSGEPFDISVRAEDAFANRATGAIPQWIIAVNGEQFRRVGGSREAIAIVDDIRFDEPGVYRFSIESVDGSIRGVANPILVVDDPDERIFWGDTHGHSGFAEGVGTAEEFMRFARDDARLDFVTHSEHDVYMDDYEWSQLKQHVRDFEQKGKFATYLGYEWTIARQQGGHHNVLFRTPDGRERIPAQLFPTLSQLYAGLRQRYDSNDIVVIPHAHNTGDYRLSDPELEPLVEIASMHGTFEWFGRMYLQHGHEVGFVAASDDHLSKPGYSIPWRETLAQKGGLGAVLAPEHSSDHIFDAMKSLRTYATTGDRMVLDFSVNGTDMGQRAPYADRRSIRGRVIGTTPIDQISIVKNDEVIWSHDYYAVADDPSGDLMLSVSMYSETYPMQPPDNPRGWRPWVGTMRIEGADLVGARLSDQSNRNTQRLRVDRVDPNLIHFATNTRGDYSSINLELRNAGPQTRLVLTLEDAMERGSAPPFIRKHQLIPGAEMNMQLADMHRGHLEKPMPVGEYADRIEVRLVDPNAADDVSFEFVDEHEVRHGDYYFMRVRQANDAMAWSSPIWIGGQPPM